jgi:acyl-CoA thioester hydrolase
MRLDLPAGLKEVHRLVIPVRWGDMDAMGHVNNTLYTSRFDT